MTIRVTVNGEVRDDATVNSVGLEWLGAPNGTVFMDFVPSILGGTAVVSFPPSMSGGVEVESIDINVPLVGEPPTPPPSDGYSEIFRSGFDNPSLSEFNNTQTTNGGVYSAVNGELTAQGNHNAKAEVGFDFVRNIVPGDRIRVRGRLRAARSGPNDLYVCDIEATGNSDPGPRLCRKNGVWAIEQNKFNRPNIRSGKTFPSADMEKFEWTLFYGFGSIFGWHELKVNDQMVIDSSTANNAPGTTGPGVPLTHMRCGMTINASGAFAEVRFDDLWVGTRFAS